MSSLALTSQWRQSWHSGQRSTSLRPDVAEKPAWRRRRLARHKTDCWLAGNEGIRAYVFVYIYIYPLKDYIGTSVPHSLLTNSKKKLSRSRQFKC